MIPHFEDIVLLRCYLRNFLKSVSDSCQAYIHCTFQRPSTLPRMLLPEPQSDKDTHSQEEKSQDTVKNNWPKPVCQYLKLKWTFYYHKKPIEIWYELVSAASFSSIRLFQLECLNSMSENDNLWSFVFFKVYFALSLALHAITNQTKVPVKVKALFQRTWNNSWIT